MWRKLYVFILSLITLLGYQFSPVEAQSSVWTAQYYNNMSLSGLPYQTIIEASPSHNWGFSAPLAGMNADQFSVRWSSSMYLSGAYRLSVKSDDGVRVYIDGVLHIDEWHDAQDRTYTADLNLIPTNHTIVIEFYENQGIAFLEYYLTSLSAIPSPTPIVPVETWTAQYYNNPSLSGTPQLTQVESSPSHNWGYGSPASFIPVDNFSARWASTQYLNGSYRLDIFCDDGVRVWVNGVLVIDEWHSATAQTYSHNFSIAPGNYLIVIEFYEDTGVAYLNYALNSTTGTVPTQVPIIPTRVPVIPTANPAIPTIAAQIVPPPVYISGSYVALISTGRLHVRSAPGAYGDVLTKVSWREKYKVIGRQNDSSWYLIQVGSITGWVSGRYISIRQSDDVTPAEYELTDTGDTGYFITSDANLNMRGGPSTNYRRIETLRSGSTVPVLARDHSGRWLQVRFMDQLGWVASDFVRLSPGFDWNRIPIK
ncbi:hypothetical protein MASR2M15_27880 [Anaerolineales bacterium]